MRDSPKLDRPERLPPEQMPLMFLRRGDTPRPAEAWGSHKVALWDRTKGAARTRRMVTWVCPTGAKSQTSQTPKRVCTT